MKKEVQFNVKKLVAGLDLPHLRNNGKWRDLRPGIEGPYAIAKLRLEFYAEQLRRLGATGPFIEGLFSELYWDAVQEMGLNQRARELATAKEFLEGLQSMRTSCTSQPPCAPECECAGHVDTAR